MSIALTVRPEPLTWVTALQAAPPPMPEPAMPAPALPAVGLATPPWPAPPAPGVPPPPVLPATAPGVPAMFAGVPAVLPAPPLSGVVVQAVVNAAQPAATRPREAMSGRRCIAERLR